MWRGEHAITRFLLWSRSYIAPLKHRMRKRAWRPIVVCPSIHFADAITHPVEHDASCASSRECLDIATELLDSHCVRIYRRRWNMQTPEFWATDQDAGVCMERIQKDYWADRADVKKVWKLSCGHFLIPAAIAGNSADAVKLADYVCATILDWIEHNRDECGVNWASPTEVSLRLSNWSLLLLTLQTTCRRLPEETQVTLLKSLHRHIVFIIDHLEADGLRTNHYAANISSLFIASVVFSGFSGCDQLQRRVRLLLERELLAQTDDQGVHFEFSLHYHRLVLELFAYPHFICLALGLEGFSRRYTERLDNMLQVLESSVNRAGFLPQIGDNDSEYLWCAALDHAPPRNVLPFIRVCRHFLDGANHTDSAWRSLLALTGFPFSRGPILQKPSPSIQDSNWRAFGGPGWFISKTPSMDVFAVCGPTGSRGLGAHDHWHQNQLIISCHGLEMITDPGTGCYTANRRLRNRLRASACHSTADLGPPTRLGGRVEDLFWIREAIHSKAKVDRRGVLRMQTARINRIHIRNVQIFDDTIKVSDRVLDRKPVVIRWVLHPEASITLEGAQAALLRRGSEANLRITWTRGVGSICTLPYSDYFSDIQETRALCIESTGLCETNISSL